MKRWWEMIGWEVVWEAGIERVDRGDGETIRSGIGWYLNVYKENFKGGFELCSKPNYPHGSVS